MRLGGRVVALCTALVVTGFVLAGTTAAQQGSGGGAEPWAPGSGITGNDGSQKTNVHATAGTPYQIGDVFVGDGNGTIPEFTPTGTLVQTLDNTTNSSEQTGMCFDKVGDLFSTNFTDNSVSKFDNAGNLLAANFGGPYNQHPESCAFDSSGNIYIGQADGTGAILKFSPSGTLLDTLNVAGDNRGSDHIDLAADQCTLFYTSEGSLVKRYDACTHTQLADFASGLPTPCYALRIRSGGDVMVACADAVVHLDASGNVIQQASASSLGLPSGAMFAMNLDPDGSTFWTLGFTTDKVVRASISSLAPISSFTFTGVGVSNAGLAVFGEQRVATMGATLTVTKTVSGTAPAGSTFTVDVACTPAKGGQAVDQHVTFDEHGTPTPADSNTIDVPSSSSCVVHELATTPPPSSVTYTCTPAPKAPPSTCAVGSDSATVTVGANGGSQATVDVTNTYTSPVVVIQPKFTG